MRLRTFFGCCRTCCYELLSYHSLVLEVICNIGELRLNSCDVIYLNNSFEPLKIKFEIANQLNYSNILNSESNMIITFEECTTINELEQFITSAIIKRYITENYKIDNTRLEMFYNIQTIQNIKD